VGSVVLARRRVRYTSAEIVWQALRRTTVDPARVPADAVAAMVALSEERATGGSAAQGDAALVAATRSVLGALVARGRLTAAVGAITAPTLLLHGRRDRLVPVAAARHAATRRPDWRVEILDECGHLAHLEDVDRTVGLIDAWLDGPGAPAAASAASLAGLTAPTASAKPAKGILPAQPGEEPAPR
jgi:pimeloyl-ACP methyl ester carboxylesterase